MKSKKLFNPIIKGVQEADLLSRTLFKIESFQYRSINEPLFYYRRHDGSKSSTSADDYTLDLQDNVAYRYMENLKRRLLLKDTDIIQHFWERAIALWFRVLSFVNQDNMNFIE